LLDTALLVITRPIKNLAEYLPAARFAAVVTRLMYACPGNQAGVKHWVNRNHRPPVIRVTPPGGRERLLDQHQGAKTMACPERTRQVQEAIVDHLKNVGAHDWEEVQKDFLDVPTSSFWRYVKKAKAQLERPVAPNVVTDLFSQGESAGEQREPWDKPELNGAFRLLKHAQRFYELHADILALRHHALDTDGRIRDPQLFAKTIRLRNQLLKDELNVVDGLNVTDVNTRFLDSVIETVAKASPEVAQAIMISLNQLNEKINGPKRGGHA
jgi:hypothetical protein